MSDRSRTPTEYLQHFADQHCSGDTEVAAGHAIVQEVLKELEPDDAEE